MVRGEYMYIAVERHLSRGILLDGNNEGANFVSTLSRDLRPKHAALIRPSSPVLGNCEVRNGSIDIEA